MAVLITGGAGFIGARAARLLLEQGEKVIVYDTFGAAEPQSLKGIQDQVEIVRGNILDPATMLSTVKRFKVKKILHTAGFVSSGLSMDQPMMAAKINIEGMLNVLEAARIYGVKRVVFLSSQRVYGKGVYGPIDEDHPKNPKYPYGSTKLAAEMLGLNYNYQYGLDFIAVRFSGVYGPGRSGGGRDNILKNMLVSAVRGVPYHLPTGGDHPWEFVHVDDAVEGLVLALNVTPERLRHRVFNISEGKLYTWKEVAEILCQLVPGSRITAGPGLIQLRPGIPDDVKGVLDITRACEELGFSPKYDLYKGLRQYIEWLKGPEGY